MDKHYSEDISGSDIVRKATGIEIEVGKRQGDARNIASHLHTAHTVR